MCKHYKCKTSVMLFSDIIVGCIQYYIHDENILILTSKTHNSQLHCKYKIQWASKKI